MSSSTLLMLVLAAAIALIIFLIVKVRLHAFLALLIACVFVGLATGMPLGKIFGSIEKGIGDTLGFLAAVIGCGTILGKLLEESGGAERIAQTFLDKLGKQNAAWVMTIVGFIAGIPVFFEVGFVLLVPLVLIVAKETKLPMLYIGIPLAVSLITVHSLLPPHPAAMAITLTLGADVGKVIFYGMLVGAPVAILAGPIWARFIYPRCSSLSSTSALLDADTGERKELPPFGITLFTIALPLLIMVGKTIFGMFLDKASPTMAVVSFFGNPIAALMISVFVAYYTLGIRQGLDRAGLLALTEKCFAPIAGILLIIGSGGAFNGILIDSGLGKELASTLSTLNLNPLILAWLIAGLLHLAVGSVTVAMISAAGIVGPMLGMHPEISPEAMVLAIGAGALGWLHVNDSAFWMVKEYLGMSLQDTLKSFTVATVLGSLIALAGVMLLSTVI